MSLFSYLQTIGCLSLLLVTSILALNVLYIYVSNFCHRKSFPVFHFDLAFENSH